MITIHSIHVGRPQEIRDESGSWRSAIYRRPVDGPIELGPEGLAGDQVADTRRHGPPDQAVCCHPLDHYAHWRMVYPDLEFQAGSVGENWTLAGGGEADLCIGDIYAVGSARVQVSVPRIPCAKQDRKLQLPDFVERTMQSLRTGFYVRVLAPGVVQAGDEWRLVERLYPDISLAAVNRCRHQAFDPDLARRLAGLPELPEGWRGYFGGRVAKG